MEKKIDRRFPSSPSSPASSSSLHSESMKPGEEEEREGFSNSTMIKMNSSTIETPVTIEDLIPSSVSSSSSSSLPSWGFSLPQFPELPKFPSNPLPSVITQNLQGIRGYFPSNLNLPNFSSAMTSIPMSSVISSFPSMPSMPSIPSMVSSAISGVSFQQPTPIKTWSQLKDSVRRAHRKLFEISGRVPFAFNFAQLNQGNTVIGTRIYFLCSMLNGSEITLYYCDIFENNGTNNCVKTESTSSQSSLDSDMDAISSIKQSSEPKEESNGTSFAIKLSNSENTSKSNDNPTIKGAHKNKYISIEDETDNPDDDDDQDEEEEADDENDEDEEEEEDDDGMPIVDDEETIENNSYGDSNQGKPTNLLRNFEWKPLIDLNMKNCLPVETNLDSSSNNYQEKLQLERKRIMFNGITSYEYESNCKRFVFTSNGHLFYFDDNGSPPYHPIRVNSNSKSAKINPAICPTNPDLIAFFSDNDVWVTHIKTGQELRLTNTKYNATRRALSAGYPCYVIQEEFRRYTGFWWRPGHSKSTGESTKLEYNILYEEVDESAVDLMHLPTSTGIVEQYRFPRPGGSNASSDLKLASFKFDESTQSLSDSMSGPVPGLQSLYSIYPHFEYLVRCGWHSRDTVWVQLLNRQQKHLVLGLFSLSKSFPAQILLREDNSPYWVNVHDFIYFLPSNAGNNNHHHSSYQQQSNKEEVTLRPGSEVNFFWISERTGFRHINLIKVQLVADEEDMRSKIAKKEHLQRDISGNGTASESNNNMEVEDKNDSSPNHENDLIGSDLQSLLLERKQLTSGEWEVNNKEIWIDERNEIVYFVGLKDTPLERHLYRVSYRDDCKRIQRLTELGFSHTLITFNPNCDLYVNIQSNISIPPFGFVHKKVNSSSSFSSPSSSPSSSQLPNHFGQSNSSPATGITSNSIDTMYFKKLGFILNNSSHNWNISMDSSCSSSDAPSTSTIMVDNESADNVSGMSKPELLTYRLKSSGDIVYGLVFKPEFMESDVKYPCVVDIYGGPEVQVVTNAFKSTRLVRRHLLAGEGYVVVAIDGRGSHNRGAKFEGHIQGRIGQVEIADQVEVLEWLAETTGYIDMSRVAIHGWSYGGYLSLMGLAQRPDIFRIAIAGAPVTNWSLYDTGYTERYLDTPYANQAAYAKGNVLNLAKNFPDEENRLLLVHGLMDENVHFIHTMQLITALIKAGKPYQIQVFPSERHSLRKAPSCEHNETQLLFFLEQHLKQFSTKLINL
ncbi:dipeptidyl peptidase 9-like isoform X2 [Panonychus citri]|nr:dipeptidyl peptidase 9-like isoform X2 [Panonychus citri]XP_053210692.1 dipeptidyl peptidase 9-like isoform X2 [Panonychus citri]